ncbi:ATP-binding cassette domain-containing protein [Bradyrhizobium sp. G127]|jgi:NitT/TauT family transport system ATP-binding protein|uniref:ABC transporter ATP-binding protein n=1 Tax=Bradyrhizobium sp. G127 TaxID=2904800 RepID=UPI001F24CC81|nr:ATP-binding cassette domain-containing protein [Bradyrhizobium sp. G127]MCF2524744.1 ATP-binding cassette domain-containing protein [Bradyrhizobium sp. G127]
MTNDLIEVTNVSKTFGSYLAVDNLSLNVQRGEIVVLLGQTGAGKSTVLNLIMGTTSPNQGSVRVAGVDPYNSFKELKGRLSVSFQTDRLLPWRTAVENAELGLLILGKPKSEARTRAQEWLRRVRLDGADDKYVHELSGGMRQRVSLARALAIDPEIVFLDESFSQLDHVTSGTLRRDFYQIAREFKKTCLLITHRIDDALEMADRAIVLSQPARIALEVRIDDEARADPNRIAELHRQIAAAMGDSADTEH